MPIFLGVPTAICFLHAFMLYGLMNIWCLLLLFDHSVLWDLSGSVYIQFFFNHPEHFKIIILVCCCIIQSSLILLPVGECNRSIRMEGDLFSVMKMSICSPVNHAEMLLDSKELKDVCES